MRQKLVFRNKIRSFLGRTLSLFAAFVLSTGGIAELRGEQPLNSATSYSERFEQWPVDYRIGGTIVCGRLPDPELLSDSLRSSERSGKVAVLLDPALDDDVWLKMADVFSKADRYSVIRGADDTALRSWLESAPDVDALVWLTAGMVEKETADLLLRNRAVLASFIERGGVLASMGPASKLLGSRFMESNPNGESGSTPEESSPEYVGEGLGLIPEVFIDFEETLSPDAERVLKLLTDQPRHVGIQLTGDQAMRLAGRRLSPVGTGAMTLMLPETEEQPITQVTYRDPERAMERRPRSANEFLADLTQWRRRAYDLKLPPFPAPQKIVPCVQSGSLVIVGGGGMPRGLMRRFVDLAGGAEKAKLVYVPCTEQDRVSPRQYTLRQWKAMGVEDVRLLHTKDRNVANSDADFHELLKDATGVWFGGGRQWNFADSYYGTKTQDLMHDVLRRGGVIGGSSAGASIQADFLARATPIENTEILAPGYWRGGLGFLRGVAIDQHFSQRGRQPDLRSLVEKFPQVLGIGIDESTAIIVEKSTASVVGDGDVYFYDANGSQKNEFEPEQLPEGSVYDLEARIDVITAGSQADTD